MKSRVPKFVLMAVTVASAGAAEVAIPMTPPQAPPIEVPKSQLKISPREPKFKAIPDVVYFPPSPRFESVAIDGLIDLFGSEGNLRIAVDSDRVEVMKLKRQNSEGYGPDAYFEEPKVSLSDHDAVVLRAMLTSDGTYNWEEDSECMPNYEFRVKFWHQKELVYIDLCFWCRMMRVVRGNQEIASKNFEYGAEALAKALEPYFPGLLEKRANQSPEPTVMSVTPRAGARVAPATTVAHL